MSIPSADWSDYQAFLAIARSGQLARAARSLGMNATTVGRRLRRLEASLGTTLFEQTRTGQSLTEAGEALLITVESMDRAASNITVQDAEADGLTGTLRVSTTEGFGTWFLAPHLHRFHALHPRLSIDLVSSSGEALSPGRRESDVAILLARPRKGPLVAHKLANYQLGVYATKSYLEAHGTPRRPADLLEGHTLVGYIPDLLNAPELRYLDEIHPGLKATLRSPSITAQHSFVASGAGIGVLPTFMARADPRIVNVLREVRLMRAFWFVTHEDIRRLPRINEFRQWLDETVHAREDVLTP